MQLSVVIPTFNRRDIVLRTVETLFAQDFAKSDYEIIVVVDGSTDGTAEALRALQAPCTLSIIDQPNSGSAAARDLGLRHARGEFVLFLDDDIRCTPGLVRAHVAAHRESSEPALVIGAVFLSDDSPRTVASDCFNAEIGSFYLAHREDPTLSFPPRAWVVMNSSVRRDLALQAGGFDAEFRMQREDSDFGFRLGLPVRYQPEAIGYEFYRKSAWALLRDAREFARGDLLLLRRHPTLWKGSVIECRQKQNSVKRRLRTMATRVPVLDLPLMLLWAVAGRCRRSRVLRHVARRAMQVHRSLVWARALREWKLGCPPFNPDSEYQPKNLHSVMRRS